MAVTIAVGFPISPHSGSFHAVTQPVYYSHAHVHTQTCTCMCMMDLQNDDDVFYSAHLFDVLCWCLSILLRLQMWTQRISKQLAMSWSRTRLSCSVSSWRLPHQHPPPLLLRHQDPQTEVSWLRCLPNDSHMQLHVSLYITSAHQQLAEM